MPITIDHVAIPVRDPETSARFLSNLLGLPPASTTGPEGEMRLLPVGEAGALLFTPAETVSGQHLAFRVDEPAFSGVVDRLRATGVAFGNDPEEPGNGLTADPFGGRGRIYFLDPDGHFYEVVA